MKRLVDEVTRMINELTEEQLKEFFKKVRPIALKAAYEQEKMDNFKKYCNRPK